MEPLKTYYCKDVIVSLGGHSMSGASDGDFITIEPHGDGTQKQVGAYGEVVRSISPDQTATITLTLQYKSPTVQWAQEQYNKDQASTDAIFPILIKDLRGSLLFSAEDAWINQNPTRVFGLEGPQMEISIDTGQGTWQVERSTP